MTRTLVRFCDMAIASPARPDSISTSKYTSSSTSRCSAEFPRTAESRTANPGRSLEPGAAGNANVAIDVAAASKSPRPNDANAAMQLNQRGPISARRDAAVNQTSETQTSPNTQAHIQWWSVLYSEQERHGHEPLRNNRHRDTAYHEVLRCERMHLSSVFPARWSSHKQRMRMPSA